MSTDGKDVENDELADLEPTEDEADEVKGGAKMSDVLVSGKSDKSPG